MGLVDRLNLNVVRVAVLDTGLRTFRPPQRDKGMYPVIVGSPLACHSVSIHAAPRQPHQCSKGGASAGRA